MSKYNVIIVAHTEQGIIPIGTSAGMPFHDKRRVKGAVKKLQELYPEDQKVAFEVCAVLPVHEIIDMGEIAKRQRENVVNISRIGDDQRVEDTSGDEALLSAPTPFSSRGSVPLSEVQQENAEAEGLSEEGQPVQRVQTERQPGEARGDLD